MKIKNTRWTQEARKTGLTAFVVLSMFFCVVDGWAAGPDAAPSNTSSPVDLEQFQKLYQAEKFRDLASICSDNADGIDQHEFVDRLLYYCGQARFRLYEMNGPDDLLVQAIDDLERSTYLYYLPATAFSLGRARMTSLPDIEDDSKRIAVMQKALSEMWGAILKRHARDGFHDDVLSDTLLSWSITYYEAVIRRIVDEDEPVVRWLTARLRMLTDRYRNVDPARGETPTRQTNLETISGWIGELYEATYFDHRPAVGVLRFLGDREMEQYDQTESTESRFLTALAHYDQALGRASSLKAKSVLKEKISYLTSLYNSDDKEKKVLYYKVGFFHANNALELINQSTATDLPENDSFPFEPEVETLVSKIQVNYGRNLSGLLYFLWEKGDYPAVVALRSAFDVTFDWKTKLDDLLRIADSAAKLARNEFRGPRDERDILTFDAYKEMCLASASQAFDYAFQSLQAARLEQNGFCSTLETYTAFLSSFGEIAEATHLTGVYGPLCPGEKGGL